MKFTFLGTSAGVPTKQRNVTGLALSMDNGRGWCLVDCGEGTQQQLLHTPYTLSTLEAIFITHVHGDHCYGLPGIIASAGMAGRKAPLKVIAPKPLGEFIEVMLRTTDCYIPYPLEFIATEDIKGPVEVCGFSVEPFALSHRVPCHAWKFTELQTQQKLNRDKLQCDDIPQGPLWGKLQAGESVELEDGRLVYGQDYLIVDENPRRMIVAGDNDSPELLLDAASDIDLLIHEATYTQVVADKVGPDPMHSSSKQLGVFANSVNLPNMLLTHFSARYGGSAENSVEQLREEASCYYSGNLFLAEDFATYQLKKDKTLKLVEKGEAGE